MTPSKTELTLAQPTAEGWWWGRPNADGRGDDAWHPYEVKARLSGKLGVILPGCITSGDFPVGWEWSGPLAPPAVWDDLPQSAPAITSQELWDLRSIVLGLGMPNVWDGEELENGFVRPIPEGFEAEVEKFDEALSRQIAEINAALTVISEMAMRQRRWEEAKAEAQKSGAGECPVEVTSRRVIERKLLTALNDKDTVALILSRGDLDFLIDAMGWAPLQHPRRGTANEMRSGLKQLRAQAFTRDAKLNNGH